MRGPYHAPRDHFKVHRCSLSKPPSLIDLISYLTEKGANRGWPSPICGAYPRSPFAPSLCVIKHGNRLYIYTAMSAEKVRGHRSNPQTTTRFMTDFPQPDYSSGFTNPPSTTDGPAFFLVLSPAQPPAHTPHSTFTSPGLDNLPDVPD